MLVACSALVYLCFLRFLSWSVTCILKTTKVWFLRLSCVLFIHWNVGAAAGRSWGTLWGPYRTSHHCYEWQRQHRHGSSSMQYQVESVTLPHWNSIAHTRLLFACVYFDSWTCWRRLLPVRRSKTPASLPQGMAVCNDIVELVHSNVCQLLVWRFCRRKSSCSFIGIRRYYLLRTTIIPRNSKHCSPIKISQTLMFAETAKKRCTLDFSWQRFCPEMYF